MEKERTPNIPPVPTTCRECGDILQCIEEEPLAYDTFTGEVRTWKKTYACRHSLSHLKMIVIENPKKEFRAVIREDKWDLDRAMGRKKGVDDSKQGGV